MTVWQAAKFRCKVPLGTQFGVAKIFVNKFCTASVMKFTLSLNALYWSEVLEENLLALNKALYNVHLVTPVLTL